MMIKAVLTTRLRPLIDRVVVRHIKRLLRR